MLLDVLAPVRCPLCMRPGPAPCGPCAATLSPALPAPRPMGLIALHAGFAYEGPVRPLIAALKYRGARHVAHWLGHHLASLVDADTLGQGWVTWAPTTSARGRQRGYDQAELLAGAVADTLQLPLLHALQRSGSNHQTGLARVQRLRDAPAFVPRAVRGGVPTGPVILVDDVCTTGATLSAAAGALRRGGCGPVLGLVAARTPG